MSEVEVVLVPGPGRCRLHRPMTMTRTEATPKSTADLLTITIKVTTVGGTMTVNTPIIKILNRMIRKFVHHHRQGYRKYHWPSAVPLLLKSW